MELKTKMETGKNEEEKEMESAKHDELMVN